MKHIALVSMIWIGMFASAGLATADPKTNPREKLDTAIKEAIRLLEAKEYAAFLEQFMVPDELKEITRKKPLDEFAKEFAERKAGDMLKVLKSLDGLKPTLDESGTTATFDPPGAMKLKWVLIDKSWYIRNR
jgi:hypothetical protein